MHRYPLVLSAHSVYLDGNGLTVTVVPDHTRNSCYPWRGLENGRRYTLCGRAWVEERETEAGDGYLRKDLYQEVYTATKKDYSFEKAA